jgi:diacylglycerol O-acyltransferase / trehalose O-mycolyltransferase
VFSPRPDRVLTAVLASTLIAGLLAVCAGPAAGRAAAPAAVRTLGRPAAQPVARPVVQAAAQPADQLSASAHERAAPMAAAADDGAMVVTSVWKDRRMLDILVRSPAVGATVPVRLLLPPGWSSTATRTWPVLYLLQGAHDDYTSWTRGTSIEAFSADKDMIVAMPSSGPTGLPTRWWNSGKNAPDYESFQVNELMQLLQRGFRASAVRSVAGVSTGGYGAVMLAAHHPGTFAAAASYSGVLDTTYPGMPEVLGAIVAREFQAPDSLWGDPVVNESLWAVDNPYYQVAKLRWTSLFISCGSGQDAGSAADVGGTLESALWQQSLAFTKRLSLLGIPAETDLYKGGVHDWSAWDGEFNKSWPMLSASLGLS